MITLHIEGSDYTDCQETSHYSHTAVSEVVPGTYSANPMMHQQARDAVITLLNSGMRDISVTQHDSHDDSYRDIIGPLFNGCPIPAKFRDQLLSLA